MTTFPNFAGKHEHDSYFSPDDFRAYVARTRPVPDLRPVEGVVMCYQQWMRPHIEHAGGVRERGVAGGSFWMLGGAGRRSGATICSIGAPAATIALEELIAFGVRRFISIGTAGALQREESIGDVVLCDGAVRDEGVSHHYTPTGGMARPSEHLTQRVGRALDDAGIGYRVGAAWTIDAPYRETVGELRHYQSQGVLCVEMEAAALFTVAAYRGVELASAFVVSDSLADLVWDPQFGSDATHRGLERLFDVAVSAL